MDAQLETNAVIRAKADAADLDQKINVIKAEETRLEMQRQKLESDRNRIMAFIEMYQRYADPAPSEDRQQTERPSSSNGVDSAGSNGRHYRSSARQPRKRRQAVHRKPAGTPRTNDMIIAALKDAQSRGLPGLAPKGMTAFIRQKWWPHLKGASVGSAAWRLHQEQRIRKEGELYALPSS